MELELYKTDDGLNVLNKVLTGKKSTTINLKRDFNILNPVIYLAKETGIDWLDFNYCKIPQLNRYYFIDTVESVTNDIVRLNCSTDVLETYKDAVLNAENLLYNREIKAGDDARVALDGLVTKNITTLNSDFTLSGDNQLILSTIGKGD